MIRHGVLFAVLAALGAASLPAPARAQACDTPSGLPVPRFVTLKFEDVRGRSGPSLNHAVRWDYARAGLPMKVVAETADWRRVRDPGGEETWMHRRTLSGRRAVEVREAARLHARPDAESPVAASAEPGVFLWLERCRAGWCRLEDDGVRGWARAETLWGLYDFELDGDAGSAESGPACDPVSADGARSDALADAEADAAR